MAVRGVLGEKGIDRILYAGKLGINDSLLVDRVNHSLAVLDVVGGSLGSIKNNDAVHDGLSHLDSKARESLE